ncbi:MAG: hypothetical protein UZ21_OP11001001157 [Microgenomates bacterium OLB22]|nr:MAG: hypothetical protein UZ21_OP11001001157 [Microgenomates bacterium OLB22]
MQAKKTKSYSRSAFTLIELLVATFIIGISGFFGVASYQAFTRGARLDAQSQAFVSVVEQAKVRARSNDKGGCSTMLRYYITINSPQTYQFKALCTDSSSRTITTKNIPDTESITISDYTVSPLLFNRLQMSVTESCVVFEDSQTSNCRKISIDSSGNTQISKECSC